MHLIETQIDCIIKLSSDPRDIVRRAYKCGVADAAEKCLYIAHDYEGGKCDLWEIIAEEFEIDT